MILKTFISLFRCVWLWLEELGAILYSRVPQIFPWRSNLLQSLAPTLIKLAYQGPSDLFENDMVCVLERGWNKTLQGCGPPGTEFGHHWSTGSQVHPSERETGKQTDQNIYFTLIFSKLCLKKLACLLLQCSDGIWKRCVRTTKRTPLLLFFQLTNIQSTARLVFCVKDRVTGVDTASKRAQRMHGFVWFGQNLEKSVEKNIQTEPQAIHHSKDWLTLVCLVRGELVPQMSLVFWGHVIFGNIVDYYWLHGYYWTRTELSWMMTSVSPELLYKLINHSSSFKNFTQLLNQTKSTLNWFQVNNYYLLLSVFLELLYSRTEFSLLHWIPIFMFVTVKPLWINL